MLAVGHNTIEKRVPEYCAVVDERLRHWTTLLVVNLKRARVACDCFFVIFARVRRRALCFLRVCIGH
jgi:hypothetical protein